MIQREYEICSNTLAVIPCGENLSKVIEKDQEIYVKQTPLEIIDHSCRFFGSSYLGRNDGTRSLLGFNYKLPIIIEESMEIIFFPTLSPRHEACCWIGLSAVENYHRQGNKAILLLKNKEKIELPISYYSLENQVFRATRLLVVLKKRKS